MKKNKPFKIIGSLIIIGIFLLFAFGSGESNSKSEVEPDYSNKNAYKSGKAAGKLAKTIGGSSYCTGDMAQEQGACVDQISKDAWCQGYKAGYKGD